MAGDWIKMRVWLHKDPVVATITDYLAFDRLFMDFLTDPVGRTCKESSYEHITSNITRHLTCSLLRVVWGVAREQGDRDGDDLVLKHCGLTNIDDICGFPSIGEAMDYVGWAIEEKTEAEKGRLIYSVRFPNFFKDNENPHDRHKRQNAEAQARHREKKRREKEEEALRKGNKNNTESNITDNITSKMTVRHREEKRREESLNKKVSINKQTFIDTQKEGVDEQKTQKTGERAKPVPAVLVEQIFEDWKHFTDNPGARLGKKRPEIIRGAVRMGYDREQLRQAFIGCARSSFHAGFNEAGKKYNDLELILRNEKNIDRFIGYSRTPPKPTWKVEDNTPLQTRKDAMAFWRAACQDAAGEIAPGRGNVIDAEAWETIQPKLAH